MRILSITAGAAGMYCGSCFRDNALAAELIAQGHDISLVPMYTPTRTDEPNATTTRRVLFGGISVYLQQRFPIFRKTPRFLDRLWDSPALISTFANRASSTDASVLGELTVSMLEGEQGILRKEFAKLADWFADEPPPDVTIITNSLLIGLAAPFRRQTGRPVLVTLQGEELFLDGLPPPYRDKAIALIRQQLRHVDRFIAVSEHCARHMRQLFAIPPSQIAVVPLGINMSGYERATPAAGWFTVGYFARVAPEKGLRLLADAYVLFKRRAGAVPTRLRAAGYLAPGPSPYLDEVKRVFTSAGLEHDFVYEGEMDRAGKIGFLRQLDVLSVPATYNEPKGFSLLEAMACGVPVVQPNRGAFTEIIEKTGGGALVPADGPQSLADGLYRLYSDQNLRRSLGDQAFTGVREHYTIGQSARRLIDVLSEVTRSTAAQTSVA
jgi:glycosyltransferase involved in cell wall biosynthesis